MIELRFESRLNAPPSTVWGWVTEVHHLRAEMRPWLWMSVPHGTHNLADTQLRTGQALFTSWLWLFGVLPIGTSRLTLLELTPGVGFVEQSPMTGMRLWRHERHLQAWGEGTHLVDRLTVRPLLATALVKGFLLLFFATRHRNLRRRQAH
ncbi:hypothetical protein ABRP29_06340 [Pseudomonas sp. WHRI 8822A]|uniref:hypothetical protein n=1 Tax=Pseudomonas sp. WHRI 8822A TaxID=3162568 RepID=UPI0032EC94BC